MEKRKKLFIPGPTEVVEEVLEAQKRWMIGHREKDFSVLYERIIEKLTKLLKTKNFVTVFTSSATGVMEGSIRNVVKEKVLSTVCGAFSHRWADIALRCGKKVKSIEVEWGKAIKPDMVERELKNNGYEAILITHNETSTGVTNPLKEIIEAVKSVSPETIILVDAVSSLAGIEILIDNWGIDVIFASVQKCFALPPGLTVTVVSERALEKAKEVKDRGYYFDFLEMKRYYDERRQTPATPAISLLYALDVQLDRMLKEGIENRYKRHYEMAEKVRRWAKIRGFELFPEEGFESNTVTVIKNNRNIDVPNLIDKLRERGFKIANGYGKLKNITFRIGHMGDLKVEEIEKLLENIDDLIS
ncbi:MAG: alanine--glyoxylate aminotransferase family protein [Candidatus Hydrothermales bacterium]